MAREPRPNHDDEEALSNSLANERSAYLRQHANNPVHWWPWCDAALDEARALKRPILLSIGYSACHWCHVMAHESFEDEATAAVMNTLFVNIKVDREDRPDLDHFYQLVHQALAGRGGGWPLTVFLDADEHLPFLAGTYFPPQPGHGLPSFTQVLKRARQWHDDNPTARRAQNRQLQGWLEAQRKLDRSTDMSPKLLQQGFQNLEAHFDSENGGHLGAPKFPHASELELLLGARNDTLSAQRDAVDAMLTRTLEGMAQGGLQDHLGGGFFRYCVDAEWEIPHFEKMLYDNAQLLGVYARAAQVFGREEFARATRHIVAWLKRDMQLAAGGLCASLDADSEGGEGAAYVWQRTELESLLGTELWPLVARRHGLDKPANFEHHAWHLTARTRIQAMAESLSLSGDTVRQQLDSAHARMFAARAQRPSPARDDKLICSWNALSISALARASRYLDDAGMLELAESTLDAVRTSLWRDGRLQRSTTTDADGFLDDHALLLDALLELLNCRWRRDDLDWAIRLADILLDDFMDREAGGFEYSQHDQASPARAPKVFLDQSLPSANGVAIETLLRLGHWLGDTRYLDAASAAIKAAAPLASRHPEACATVLRALQRQQQPPAHLLVRATAEAMPVWRKTCAATPQLDAWLIPAEVGALPGLLAGQIVPDGASGQAWLCRGTTCLPPLDTPEDLAQALNDAPSA
ncbi:MAG: thioredoxin domain-containing protein [Rhodanobacteraceae bacterium]